MKPASSRRLRLSLLCGSLVCSAALSVAGPAQADSAAADALFEEGKRLMAEENYVEACKKFDASYKLDKTLGTLLNLANCNESVGLIATAWAQWGEAVERAKKAGDARADYAQDRRDDLTERLPYLTITVVNPAEGLKVRRGDAVLAEGTFGVSLPVDPGQQVIQVLRGEQVLKQEVVTLEEKEKGEVKLDLAAIDKAVPPEAPPPAPPPSVVTVTPNVTPPPSGDTQRTVGFVVGGVGVAALVAAGVFGVIALSKKGSADEPDACVGDEEKFCTPDGLSDVDGAKTFANLTQWVGIGGIVVTIVGATLILTAPSGSELDQRAEAEPPEPKVWASPWFGPEGAGLGAGGTF